MDVFEQSRNYVIRNENLEIGVKVDKNEAVWKRCHFEDQNIDTITITPKHGGTKFEFRNSNREMVRGIAEMLIRASTLGGGDGE